MLARRFCINTDYSKVQRRWRGRQDHFNSAATCPCSCIGVSRTSCRYAGWFRQLFWYSCERDIWRDRYKKCALSYTPPPNDEILATNRVVLGLSVQDHELVDLTELTYGNKWQGVYPSAGGCGKRWFFVCLAKIRTIHWSKPALSKKMNLSAYSCASRNYPDPKLRSWKGS